MITKSVVYYIRYRKEFYYVYLHKHKQFKIGVGNAKAFKYLWQARLFLALHKKLCTNCVIVKNTVFFSNAPRVSPLSEMEEVRTSKCSR